MSARRLGLIITVVLAAGLIWAGFAALRHVRRESSDKSISSYQIQAALNQYFLENPSATSVQYDDLIGPDKFIRAINPVDGEDYHELFPIRQGYRELALTMGDGRRVILFDGHTLRQETDGRFSARYNPDPRMVESYRRWIAAGRPPH